MKMRNTGCTVFVVLASACLCQAAITTIFSDNFDSYADQAAFNAAWNVGLVGGGGTLSTGQAYSPSNSIRQGTTAQASGMNIAPCWGTDAEQLEWSFRFYDSTQTANLRQFATIRDLAPSTAQLVAMGAYNDATMTKDRYTGLSASATQLNTYYAARVAFSPGPGWFILNGPDAPTRTTGWHELKAVFKDTSVDFYIDGVNALTGLTISYANSVGAISFDRVTVGSGLSSVNGVGYYDDVLVNRVSMPVAVPAPGAIALGMFGLSLVGWVKRRMA